MTVTTSAPSGGGEAAIPPEDLVTLTIDGIEISVPKGTLVIRAAELLGIEIPRFCDHPLLDPASACRQCIVEVEGQRKPMASCTITCTDGMVVKSQITSPVAEKAQKGVMELLLINHPLDCPVCDKGGECPLQNQAMSHGGADSRFEGKKRTFEKPVPISTQVLLDRERCVLCARCTRFSNQVAGDPMIELIERGALQQVGTGEGDPFESYFSGNTIQICPVGALTSAAYRFRSRPFDLVSTPSVCEQCAGGCSTRTDHRRGKVMRRLAANEPEVNEEWLCDKGRFGFRYAQQRDRLTTPLVRNAEGELEPASWPEALEAAAAGLLAARGRTGVLTGGRLTVEDAYAYSKFARVALDTNDVDFRSRVHSAEEADFLAARVAGRGRDLDGEGVTYTALEKAPAVLLVGFESEEEAPGVFLRLRKAHRKSGQKTFALASHATRGLVKAGGTLLPAAPGTETEWLDALAGGVGLEAEGAAAAEALRGEHSLIIVGERLAGVPGALSAAVRTATATGARLVWIPRRAGDRGAVEAGALPTLLPGGRPATDPRAREEVAELWRVAELPSRHGRDTGQIVEAAATGELGALLVAACRRRGPARPEPRHPGAERGRLPGLAGTAAERGLRPGGRGLPGRRRRGEVRHLPQLGGPGPDVPGGAEARADGPDARADGLPGAAHAGRRDGRALRPAGPDRRPSRAGPARRLGGRPRGGPARERAAAAPARRRRGGPRGPPDAARPRPASRTATPRSPGPGTRPSPGSRRSPPPSPASRTATCSPSPAPQAPSNCPSRSPTCRTGWSGCR